MLPNSSDPALLNRELSLLKFNERVLAMAERSDVPLLERLRYLCIVGSNLDEFFEIRISSLKEQQRQNPDQVAADGYTPDAAFGRIHVATHELVDRQNFLLTEAVLPALKKEGIALMPNSEWNEATRQWAHALFLRDVIPLLTPIGLDPAHPFPRVYNKSLNFIVPLSGVDAFGRSASIAILQAPRALPRLIKVPVEICGVPHGFVLLTSLIRAFISDLFPGLEVKGCYQWRVTRNSDLFVDEEEITNLRQALQGELSQRNFGAAVRLEIDDSTPEHLEVFLQNEFSLTLQDTYRVRGPVNLARLMQLCNAVERPDLSFLPYRAPVPAPFDAVGGQSDELFAAISRQDQLLHHPYQAFQPVLDFLTAAATDPNVVAIKQTIYRTGEDSELMRLLVAAAKAGKEVTVVVELMARFDEQTNINWAAKLEEVGAHVSYGVVGHKTHAKMVLVLRREGGRIKRYGHLGTGNYHPRTTRFYTDFGLLTANEEIGEDVATVFKQLTGLGTASELRHLWQAPFSLQPKVVEAIRREAEIAREGRRGRIIAKMNALLEPETIEALYEASQAGVEIDLIVRGPCALKPGVPGLSDNIRVRSVIGRFLEHHRIFHFHADGADLMFLSSADWMDRNFFRRIEIAFPVLDPRLKRRVMKEGLRPYLGDNCQAWEMQSDGSYKRKNPRGIRRAAQLILLQELAASS